MRRFISRIWGWLTALSGWAKALIAVALAALVGFLIWAVFFWFAFQTYFIDDKVDEDVPVFASGAGATEAPVDSAGSATSPAADGDATPEATAPAGELATPQATAPASGSATAEATAPASGSPTAESAEAPAEGAGAMPGDEISAELQAEMDEVMEQEGMPEVVEVQEEMPEMPEQPQVRVEASGEFISRSHPTQGSTVVLGDGTGQRFLRFEDFRTDNGPDLNVYLSSAPPDAPAGQFDDDFVDLGDLKGNVGSQNYEIPRDVDLERYSTVVVWCVRFSVAFGAADLLAA